MLISVSLNGTPYDDMSAYTALSIPQSKPVTLDLKYGLGLGRDSFSVP